MANGETLKPRREMKTFGFCRFATTFPGGLW